MRWAVVRSRRYTSSVERSGGNVCPLWETARCGGCPHWSRATGTGVTLGVMPTTGRGCGLVVALVALSVGCSTDRATPHSQASAAPIPSATLALLAQAPEGVEIDQGVFEMEVPRLGLRVLVVEGRPANLRAGVVHSKGTPFPCQAGQVEVVGSATRFGRPFHNLQKLEDGDSVVFRGRYLECSYQVTDELQSQSSNPKATEARTVHISDDQGKAVLARFNGARLTRPLPEKGLPANYGDYPWGLSDP